MKVETLKNRIIKVRKNLTRRLKRLEAKYGETPALASFKSANLNLSLRNRSEEELRDLYDQLKYFNSLKTSTVKGYKSYLENFKDIEEALDVFADPITGKNDLKDKFWKLYSNFVEEKTMLDKFKYEIMDVISSMLVFGESSDEKIKKEVEQLYDTLYEQSKYGASSSVKSQKLNYTANDINSHFQEFDRRRHGRY